MPIPPCASVMQRGARRVRVQAVLAAGSSCFLYWDPVRPRSFSPGEPFPILVYPGPICSSDDPFHRRSIASMRTTTTLLLAGLFGLLQSSVVGKPIFASADSSISRQLLLLEQQPNQVGDLDLVAEYIPLASGTNLDPTQQARLFEEYLASHPPAQHGGEDDDGGAPETAQAPVKGSKARPTGRRQSQKVRLGKNATKVLSDKAEQRGFISVFRPKRRLQ